MDNGNTKDDLKLPEIVPSPSSSQWSFEDSNLLLLVQVGLNCMDAAMGFPLTLSTKKEQESIKRAEYLRYYLKTVIAANPKVQKKSSQEFTRKLFDDINNLDYAAKNKSSPQAEKYYVESVSTLNNVLAKHG